MSPRKSRSSAAPAEMEPIEEEVTQRNKRKKLDTPYEEEVSQQQPQQPQQPPAKRAKIRQPLKDYKQFEGDEVLDINGNVVDSENKELRVKSFILPERDDNLRFALVLDISRALGPGDSHRFYRNNPELQKEYLTAEEREMLIEQGLVHPIMKYRNVPIVPVTQAYMIYGDKVVKNIGEDDYAQEGELNAEDDSGNGVDLNQQKNSNVEIPNLKPPGQVARPNGDWIYKCALKAAQFNVQLRLERADRLYGVEEIFETKPKKVVKEEVVDEGRRGSRRSRLRYKEAESDDEFEESEEEEEEMEQEDDEVDATNDDESQNQPQEKKYRKKNGFYDIHTNVIQVPHNTQIQNYRVESFGLTMDDLLKGNSRRANETSNENEAEGDEAKPKSSGQVIEPTFKELSAEENELLKKGQSAYVKSLPFRGTPGSDQDAKLYPLVLMDGQKRTQFSIYNNRFGNPPPIPYRGPPRGMPLLPPGSQQPLLVQGHAGQMNVINPQTPQAMPSGQPPLGRIPNSRSQRLSGVPFAGQNVPHTRTSMVSTMASYKAPSEKASTVSRQSLTPSKHSRTATPTGEEKELVDDGKPRCSVCTDEIPRLYVEGQSVDETRDPLLLASVELINSNAIQCTQCFLYYHFKCMSHTNPAMEAKMRMYRWECSDCKYCFVCREHEYKRKEGPTKGEVLICDECDRGYHMKCIQPPLEKIPKGNWYCSLCTQCDSCEKEFDKKDLIQKIAQKNDTGLYLTSLCKNCDGLFNEQKYCVVCLKTHNADAMEEDGESDMEAIESGSEELDEASDDDFAPRGTPKKQSKRNTRKKRNNRGGKKKIENTWLSCKSCQREVHYPSCDYEVYKKDKMKVTESGYEYHCPACRALTPPGSEQPQEALTEKQLVLEKYDEEELQRKGTVLQEQVSNRKRGRPKKYREEFDIANEPDEPEPVKERELIMFEGKVVGVPFMRNLYGWYKW